MNDLDSLATAALSGRASAKPRRRGYRRSLWIGLGIVALAAVVIPIVMATMHRGGGGTSNSDDDPQFFVEPFNHLEGISYSEGFSVVNRSSRPLIINDMLINGEYHPSLASPVSEHGKPTLTLPATITIGDQITFISRSTFGTDHYKKSMVYVDVKTDRGIFRFKGLGLTKIDYMGQPE